jgi:hypothetical protein
MCHPRTALLALTGVSLLFATSAMTRAQTVYVINNGNNALHAFSTTGQDMGTVASSGLNNATAIAINKVGDLYVTNENDPGTVVEFSPTGTHLATLTGGNGNYGLAIDGAGDILVDRPYQGSGAIHLYSSTNVDLGTFATAHLNIPAGIAINAVGDVFVDNQRDGTIQEFAGNGAYLGLFATVPNGTPYPQLMAFNPNGDLFVTTNNSDILEYSPTGTLLADILPTNLALSGTDGIAFLNNGDFLVSYYYSNVIEEFSPIGADLGAFASVGLNEPVGIAVSAATPEPGAYATIASLGLTGAAFLRRRRRAR